jgi:hypothetical protein
MTFVGGTPSDATPSIICYGETSAGTAEARHEF